MYKKMKAISIALTVCAFSTSASMAYAQPDSTTPVTGQAASNTAINARDKSDDTLKPMDQPNDSADIRLAASVRKAIVGDKSLSSAGHNVKLIAANGVVTLRGPVQNDAEKTKVARIAAGIGGVTSVDNQLDVKSE